MKTLLAFLLGAVVFLAASAAIWLYLATRTAVEGHSQPHFTPDRVTAILLSLALGSAIGAAGRVYIHFKGYKTVNGWLQFILMIILPFISSFILLFISHSQLHSMQYSDSGEPQSPWGYLIICGLPVVAGLFAGGMIEKAYPTKKE